MIRSNPPAPEAAPPPAVRIRLALKGVELEFRGARSFFDRHVAPLMEAAYAHAGLPAGSSPEPTPEPRALPAGPVFQPSSPPQFRQFAAQVGARAATPEQRIMAFVFYLWNYEKQEDVQPDEVLAFFRTVLEEPPDDLVELIATLVDARRFLARVGDGDTFRLTPKGVNYVKNRLLTAV